MDKAKNLALIISLIIYLLSGGFVYAQSKIPKDKYSRKNPVEVTNKIKKLNSSDPKERALAAYELGEMGKKAAPAIPFLLELVKDTSPLAWNLTTGAFLERTSPAEEAIVAVAKISYPEIEPVVEVFNLAEKEAAKRVINGLGRKDWATNVLLATLKNKDPQLRLAAIHNLGGTPDIKKNVVEILISALRDPYPEVREAAAGSFNKFSDKRSVKPLIAALRDKNAKVKERAAYALGEIRDKEATLGLVELMKDQEYGVRTEANTALVKLNDTRAIEPIIALLNNPDEDIRSNAIDFLMNFKELRVEKAFITALKDDSPRIRERAANCLSRSKSIEAVSALIDLLDDKEVHVKGTARYHLREISGQDFGLNKNEWQQWWNQKKKTTE